MDSRPALSHTGCFGGSAAAAGAPLPAQLARSLACAAVATQAQRQDARSSATPMAPSTATRAAARRRGG